MPERALHTSAVLALALVACGTDVTSTEAQDASVPPSGEDAAAPEGDSATAPACSEATSPFVPAGGYALALGGLGTVFPAPGVTGNMLAGQSNAGFGLDVAGPDGKPLRKIFVNFSTHDDVAGAPQTDGVVTSLDGALTFGGYLPGVMSPPAFAIQLRDARVLSYGFVPTVVTTGTVSTLTVQGKESVNDGNTWKAFAATVKLPQVGGSVGRLSGHPTQLSDGTLLLPYYGRSAGDVGGYRAELLASSDGGRTFVVRGNIAVPPINESYVTTAHTERPSS
jgi:hypothetical protein